ncbi:MAG TPA: acetate kinase [Ktedonobacteraceae bacterium]
MKILVLNAGSSSQKVRLYELAGDREPQLTPPAPLWAADIDWSQQAGQVTVTISVGTERSTLIQSAGSRQEILVQVLQMLWQGEQAVVEGPADIAVVGHRVVHGGAKYRQSVLVTPEVLEDLRQLIPFAPLHEPANLEGIAVVEHLYGPAPQIAVFDTAFHRQMPLVAQTYPGSYSWFEQGIRRYGFHGISHQYCAHRSAELVGQDLVRLRIVTCHLGNGCSLAAIRGGASIDTTMGFTPLEGLMMDTRSGSLDPTILLYLQREQGLTIEQLDHLLNRESGLKGISGLSGDIRTILGAIEQGNERAVLALDLYIYRLRASLGSMIATLEGIDVLTFTGGIGEHVPLIRTRLCQNFGFLGLSLDESANGNVRDDQDIATPQSSVRMLVVHAEEDWEIARSCWQMGTHLPGRKASVAPSACTGIS